jgi:hypothetical protein
METSLTLHQKPHFVCPTNTKGLCRSSLTANSHADGLVLCTHVSRLRLLHYKLGHLVPGFFEDQMIGFAKKKLIGLLFRNPQTENLFDTSILCELPALVASGTEGFICKTFLELYPDTSIRNRSHKH